ncbi:MAG: zinc-binding dehydrogenase [Burkholderiales bacterium]|nr:zinc-binding dehydrogenase [Anaerolineae bacterium]
MKVAPGVGNVELREIDEPTTQPGQVKIRVERAGLCGTDLHILKDEFRSWPPVVLGHEVAGEIAEVGEGVTGLQAGQRVTTETYFSTCGQCRYCRSGQNNLCLNRRSIGSAVNGGFTQYVVVPAKNIHILPDNVDYEAGALTEPLACVVHAVTTTPAGASVSPGDVAVIAGPGAIGLLTLQVVKAAGATVVMLGTDVDGKRLSMARELGADYVVNVQQQDGAASEIIRDLTDEGLGADVVYECSGAGPAASQLLTLARRRGRYVQIGLYGKSIAWDMDQVCFRELTVTGSNASIPSAWLKALRLISTGTVQTKALVTHQFDITDWEAAFATFEDRTGVKALFRPVG